MPRRLNWGHLIFLPFWRGWGTLMRRYAAPQWTRQNLVMQNPVMQNPVTSARFGTTFFQGTVSVVLGESGVAFQRVSLFGRPVGRGLHIPYSDFRMIAPYQERGGLLLMPVFGRFEVDRTEIWLDQPYSGQLTARLAATP